MDIKVFRSTLLFAFEGQAPTQEIITKMPNTQMKKEARKLKYLESLKTKTSQRNDRKVELEINRNIRVKRL